MMVLVQCVAAMPDGVHFVVGLHLTESVARSAVPRRRHARPHLQGAHGNAVAVTPDGQHIISGSDDKLVKVWSVASKSLVSTAPGTTAAVHAVAAMPDGQRILSGAKATRQSACGSSTALSRTPSSCTPTT